VESFNRQTLLGARKAQNHPKTYGEIVRKCRDRRIMSHFSNIIGFPQETEQEVHEHVQVLREMAPTWASFYILCPIPGTEQYDDFLAEGLITETNLDRFDTTCLTWRHSFLSRERLSQLLFDSYCKFFSLRHSLGNVREAMRFRRRGALGRSTANVAMSLFTRLCARRRTHPMSGGVQRVRLDRVNDFLPLRRQTFGFELAPLPRSLQLPAAESLLQPGPPTRVVAGRSSVPIGGF
jgi:hypothetical protein